MNDELTDDETESLAPPNVSNVPTWLLDAIDELFEEGRWQEIHCLIQRLERTLQ